MPTWLVTGASGFFGSNAGIWLNGKVHSVGMSRTFPSTKLFDQTMNPDLCDSSALASAIRLARPQVILHAAALSGHAKCAEDPAKAYAVNVESTRVISDVASEIGSRLIFISTDSVFSGDDGGYSESDPTEPFSYYGETKQAGEQIVLSTAPNALIIRTNFFGWSEIGNKSVLEFFTNALRSDRPVQGFADSIVTSLYVQTLLDAIWRLEEMGAAGIVHVASRDALSKYDFGIAVAKQFGLRPELIAHERSGLRDSKGSRGRNLSLNTNLLTSLLNHPPQSQAQGIEQAFTEERHQKATLKKGFKQ